MLKACQYCHIVDVCEIKDIDGVVCTTDNQLFFVGRESNAGRERRRGEEKRGEKRGKKRGRREGGRKRERGEINETG